MYHDISLHSTHAADAAVLDGHIPQALIDQTEAAVIDAITKICSSTVNVDDKYKGCEHRRKIIGSISFVGDLMWTMALHLPHDSSEALAKKFAGFEITFESDDMGDVVGEIINVLAGVLSGKLNDVGVASHMSLPTVTRGNAFEIMLPDSLVAQQFYFSTDDSDFCVEITAMKTF